MVEIEDKIVSDDIFEEFFVCDYARCKGICCVEGDSGAPLDLEETDILEEAALAALKYMKPEGVKSVESNGVFVIDSDGDYTTPLIDGAECAYSFQENDFTMCAIERAWFNKETTYRKPISCHLYPIRITKLRNGFTALNYHRWNICCDAVKKGQGEGVKVYQALREPIVRAFGEEFFGHLCEVDKILEKGDIE